MSEQACQHDFLCVGIAEWDEIAPGMEATDAVLKAAPVKLEQAFTGGPGRWFVMISGEREAVETAIGAAHTEDPSELRDSAVLPDLSREVLRALQRAQESGEAPCVGVIECDGLVAGICAANAAVRATRVQLLQVRLLGELGGKSLVTMAGSEADVEKAIEVAREETDGRAATVSSAIIRDISNPLRAYIIANR